MVLLPLLLRNPETLSTKADCEFWLLGALFDLPASQHLLIGQPHQHLQGAKSLLTVIAFGPHNPHSIRVLLINACAWFGKAERDLISRISICWPVGTPLLIKNTSLFLVIS